MATYRNFKAILIRATSVLMAGYFIWVAVAGMPEPLVVRPIFVGFVILLGFLGAGVGGDGGTTHPAREILNWLLGALGVAQAIYIQVEYERIVTRLIYFDDITLGDWFFGVTTILVVLELTRRMVGNTLVILVASFVFYTIFGYLFPGFLRHPGIEVQVLLEQFFLSTNGLFGSLTSLALAEVLMFIFLGAFLQAAGGTEFFTRLAEAATKKARGGPAKASVIGSALFGAISGSGVANVYATGSVTIPMMKRAGFRAEFAGAVEAVSSALGQIIPPIMGATAFIIAQYARTSYLDVATAALVPSLLYIFAVYTAVHMETNRLGIGIFRSEIQPPSIIVTFRDYGHLLLPILILIVLLMQRYTAHFSATVAALSVIGLSVLRPATRMSWRGLLGAVETAISRVVSMTVTLVAAGLAVSALSSTGTVFKVSAMIIALAQGNFLIVCVLVALTTIVLGMGLPPVGAFLIASVFGAPALMEFGVDAFTAYMFIFMFGVVALITPPVCLTSFAAASIAETDFMRTGIKGFIIALPAYFIPFIIIHDPIYLHITAQGVVHGLWALFTALIGIVSLVGCTVGYLINRTAWPLRILLLAAALSLLWPGLPSDIGGITGLLTVVLIQLFQKSRHKKFQNSSSQAAFTNVDV
jgi:TRAP transporter 4TM/12TM fusion protein